MPEPPGELRQEIIAECLEALEAGDLDTVELACTVHRELAAEIRSLMRMHTALGGQGGLGQVGPSLVGSAIHQYRIVGELGRGGVGVVYEAYDTHLDRSVALKVLAAHGATREDLARFRREALALARARHPHVTSIHDVGMTSKGRPYFVMDLIRGASLDERLKAIDTPEPETLKRADLLPDSGRLEHMNIEVRLRVVDGNGHAGGNDAGRVAGQPAGRSAVTVSEPTDPSLNPYVAAIVRIGNKVADALDHAHQAGVVHRDVKPANILIDADGQPHLVDFGLAFGVGNQTVTRTAAIHGTPLYMSPEQIQGDRGAIGPRTDVYALGVTLYHALALQPPFKGDSSSVLFSRIEHSNPPSLRALNPAVPITLQAVIMKAMERRPERRYVSAAALRDELAAVLDGRPVEARPPGPWRRAGDWLARHPAAVASSGMLLLLAGAVATLYLLVLAFEGEGSKEFSLPGMSERTISVRVVPPSG
ncbi:MAG: serine/threonine-protein kinase [Planctomycetota bacterium]|jgi:serine/threonine protein kinase